MKKFLLITITLMSAVPAFAEELKLSETNMAASRCGEDDEKKLPDTVRGQGQKAGSSAGDASDG